MSFPASATLKCALRWRGAAHAEFLASSGDGSRSMVAAAPHRLDGVLALRRVGELQALLPDEHVDDLEFLLVHAAVEMIEEHLLGQLLTDGVEKGLRLATNSDSEFRRDEIGGGS